MSFPLRNIFRSAARGAVITALAGCSFFAPAATLAQSRTEISPASADTRLSTLRQAFAATPLGKDLLAFSDKARVSICFDHTLYKETSQYAVYDPNTNSATIDSSFPLECQIFFLAHELRHGWQAQKIRWSFLETKSALVPSLRWTLRQYLEADAGAYSLYFMADRMERLGIADGYYASCATREEQQTIDALRQEMGTGGVSPAEYRECVFKPEMARIGDYTEKHYFVALNLISIVRDSLDSVEHKIKTGDSKKAMTVLNSIEGLFRTTPSKALVEHYLRIMGSTSLNTPDIPSLLDTVAVSGEDLFDRYPFLNDGSAPAARRAFIASALAEADQQSAEMQEEIQMLRNKIILAVGRQPQKKKL